MLSLKQLQDAARCKGTNCHNDCTWKDCYNIDEYAAMNMVAQTALAYRDMLKKLLQVTEGFDYRSNVKFTMSDVIGLEMEIKEMLKEE